MFLSRIIHRLRALFPTEITGLVVLMVGVTLIPLGASKFVGIEVLGDVIQPRFVIVAALTLAIMIGLNVWGKGNIKLYCVLIGMLVGYVLSFIAGILTPDKFEHLGRTAWFALPGEGSFDIDIRFDPGLILPFAIVALCGSMKSLGNLITVQKINDADWKEPDMRNIGNGLFADSLSIFCSGLLGGVATDTSASNVGMSLATGATSRVIGFAAGGLFICLGFLPKMAAFFSIMPPPVMGAILIFVTSFMVLAGFQIILTSAVNTRKIFIIGMSFIFGLSVDMVPGLYASIPSWLQPVFGSSLTLSTVMAIILNQILSIGNKSEAE